MYSSVGWSSSRVDLDVEHVDPRLPAAQRVAHLEGDQPGRRGVGRGEDVVVDRAPELGAHRALAGRRAEDQAHALGDLLVARHEGDAAARPDAHRVGDPAADEPARSSAAHPPIITVGAPMTIGAPQPAMSPDPQRRAAADHHRRAAHRERRRRVRRRCGGKLHVCRSPTTAAGIPPMSTVATPGPGDHPGMAGRVADPVLLAASSLSPRPQLIVTIEPRTVVWPLLDSSAVPLPSTFAWHALGAEGPAAGVDRHAVGLELERRRCDSSFIPLGAVDRRAWPSDVDLDVAGRLEDDLVALLVEHEAVLAVAGGDRDGVVLVVQLDPVAVARRRAPG